MSKWLFLLGAIGTVVLYQNCSATHESLGGGSLSSNDQFQALSLAAYQKTLFPIVSQETNCARCHGVTQQPLHSLPDPVAAHDITVSFGLVNWINPADSALVRKIRGNHQGIPQTLADDMEAAIQAWADEIVAGGGFIGVPEGELGPSFASVKSLILDVHCTSCHSPTGTQPSVDYTDYVTTINTGGIEPGNAAGSAMFIECNSGRMPQGGERLSTDELNAIRDWINQGALNN